MRWPGNVTPCLTPVPKRRIKVHYRDLVTRKPTGFSYVEDPSVLMPCHEVNVLRGCPHR